MTVTLVRDDRFIDHDPGSMHPESPERLRAVYRALDEDPGVDVRTIAARAAARDELTAVHSERHVERIEGARGQTLALDPDTFTSPGSVDAALLAAGGAVDLAVAVAAGDAPPGILLARPPGHHATRERAMGFCLFNSVAVAARALLDRGLAERVAIYDWDVHHGNGTQDIFYEDPRVLYMSTHRHPFYPGTGLGSETGRGAGEGFTVNVPLPVGSGDEALIEASRELFIPRTRDFAPDVILISAGYDAHEADPIGAFTVTEAGFSTLADMWRSLAEELCGGRIAATLEGGYDAPGLARCVTDLLKVWSS